MRRREFIMLLGGSVAAWPLVARAQQPDRMRHIGVLMGTAADDSESQARTAAFAQGLAQLGWADGRNVQIDTRWATTNADDIRRHAAELVALTPDVILAATGTLTVAPLLQATQTVPIVFVLVIDPGRRRFRREPRTAGRQCDWVHDFRIRHERKMAGAAQRDRAPRDAGGGPSGSNHPSGIGQFAAVQAVAPSLGVELSPVDVHDVGEIERAVAAFARADNGGLIVTASALATRHRDLIIALAARHKLPAIYAGRWFVTDGGLLSYGPDYVAQFRQAAGYVDRVLKGEKPADLPVQSATKYETVINLKTAKALGITVPPSLLATADEVIE
jgi:putative ABC transport system substrate-binding protein